MLLNERISPFLSCAIVFSACELWAFRLVIVAVDPFKKRLWVTEGVFFEYHKLRLLI